MKNAERRKVNTSVANVMTVENMATKLMNVVVRIKKAVMTNLKKRKDYL